MCRNVQQLVGRNLFRDFSAFESLPRSFSLFLVALTSNSRKSLDQKPFFAKKHLGQECGRESGGGGGRLLNSFFFFFN